LHQIKENDRDTAFYYRCIGSEIVFGQHNDNVDEDNDDNIIYYQKEKERANDAGSQVPIPDGVFSSQGAQKLASK